MSYFSILIPAFHFEYEFIEAAQTFSIRSVPTFVFKTDSKEIGQVLFIDDYF